jgi:hypothetical protein
MFGRKLMPGERYCVHRSKVRRFLKRDAQYRVPNWCPRLHRSLIIRLFVKAPETYFDFAYRKKYGESEIQYVDARKYVLQFTGSTPLTPKQFVSELTSGLADFTELLNRSPRKDDVLEISNGISSAVLWCNKDFRWEQLGYFDTAKCDDGSIGGIAVKPHDNQYLERFSHNTEEYEKNCIGHMRGYFTEGRFQSRWEEGRHDLALPSMWTELEALLEALKTHGFLRGKYEMQDYCWRFPQGALSDEDHSYGYVSEMKDHCFYARCLPGDENYNIYLYVYPKILLSQEES